MRALSTVRSFILFVVIVQAAIFLNGAVATGATRGNFPPFLLNNWDGREVSLESLRGNRSIIVFTFARCVYSCPMITQYLKVLDDTEGNPGDLRLVHVSVNPSGDTAEEILKHFRKFGIDPEKDPRWLFLNGPVDRTEAMLAENGIEVRKRLLPEGDLIEHTIRVVVLDRGGEVVEIFDTYLWDGERMKNALQRAIDIR